MRDLFIRHDRLSGDQVERLRKRVDANSHKLEGVRQAKKDGWEGEADRIAGLSRRTRRRSPPRSTAASSSARGASLLSLSPSGLC